MDGTFSDLNPDVLIAELEDYSKDTYKLLKVFTNRFKKQQVQRDERERERKKSYRRKSTAVAVTNPELVALSKPEHEVVQLAAISVCERVIAQQNDFRVNVTLLSNSFQFITVVDWICVSLLIVV